MQSVFIPKQVEAVERFAHKDMAFKFASLVSAAFEFYLVKSSKG